MCASLYFYHLSCSYILMSCRDKKTVHMCNNFIICILIIKMEYLSFDLNYDSFCSGSETHIIYFKI